MAINSSILVSNEVTAMLKTLEGTLGPEGTITFREDIQVTKSQRVLVTLLGDADAPVNGERGGVERVLALLARPEFRDRPVGSAAALETAVAENRAA
jgi:hypothetical protein